MLCRESLAKGFDNSSSPPAHKNIRQLYYVGNFYLGFEKSPFFLPLLPTRSPH